MTYLHNYVRKRGGPLLLTDYEINIYLDLYFLGERFIIPIVNAFKWMVILSMYSKIRVHRATSS